MTSKLFGKNNPNYRGGKYINCLTCGKRFWISPYNFGKKKFCSLKCSGKAKSKSNRGDNNPMRKYPKLRKDASERMKGEGNPAKCPKVRGKLSASAIRRKRIPYSKERKASIKKGIHISRKIHDEVLKKRISEFEKQGYRVIPTDEGYPRPDLILIKGENVKIYAFEIETRAPSVTKLEKFDDYPYYDDIIWYIADKEWKQKHE